MGGPRLPVFTSLSVWCVCVSVTLSMYMYFLNTKVLRRSFQISNCTSPLRIQIAKLHLHIISEGLIKTNFENAGIKSQLSRTRVHQINLEGSKK